MNYKYPLASSSWDESELEAMQRSFPPNHLMGKKVREFEKNLPFG